MENDTGSHYRREYKGIKLDPARICRIYNVNCVLQSAIVKKTLCAGGRGHKEVLQDIDDIITAAERWKEIILEDLMPEVRADHMMVRTDDYEKSIRFYTEIAGMSILNEDDRMFEKGYKTVFLGYGGHQDFKLEVTYNPEKNDSVVSGQMDHFAIYVKDLDTIIKSLQSRHVEYDLEDHFHGEKEYKFLTVETPEKFKIIFIRKVKG